MTAIVDCFMLAEREGAFLAGDSYERELGTGNEWFESSVSEDEEIVFHYDLMERNTFDDSPEEREATFEEIWDKKGFSLWLGGYKDYLFNPDSNRIAYDFWRKKQMSRVKNPEKQKLLFPEE